MQMAKNNSIIEQRTEQDVLEISMPIWRRLYCEPRGVVYDIIKYGSPPYEMQQSRP